MRLPILPPLATTLLAAALVAVIVSAAEAQAPPAQPKWLPATAEKLPRWRGFNLLEKFYRSRERKPFLEEDFQLISKLGFNFVRLPMDYRCWIQGDHWLDFDEATLRQIDQAVAWGGKYGIHVCINFHRAPGYTVAQPAEKTSLWTDAETQRVCALHWATFARRYRGIPNERVSLNLMNEPGKVDPAVYAAVVRKLVAAIRSEDPQRLVISDGIEWGRIPVLELADLHIAQATRGYTPIEISHYKASWIHGGENLPFPRWPQVMGPSGTLLGPQKKEGSHPLVIDGPLPAVTALRLHVERVSSAAALGGRSRRGASLREAVQVRSRQRRVEESRAAAEIQDLSESLRPRLHGHDPGRNQAGPRSRGRGGLAPHQSTRAEAGGGRGSRDHGRSGQSVRQAAGALPLRPRRGGRSAAGSAGSLQGVAVVGVHCPLERGRGQRDRRHRWRVGFVQQDPPRRHVAVGRRLPEQLEAGRLGLGDVELPRQLRSPRQWAGRRPIRGIRGP